MNSMFRIGTGLTQASTRNDPISLLLQYYQRNMTTMHNSSLALQATGKRCILRRMIRELLWLKQVNELH